jgi:hypothetical protein
LATVSPSVWTFASICGILENDDAGDVKNDERKKRKERKEVKIALMLTSGAIKAPNFEPHGNFGPFFFCKFRSFFGWIMYQIWTETNL